MPWDAHPFAAAWRPARLHESAGPGGRFAPNPDGPLMRVRRLMMDPSRAGLREAAAKILSMREAGRPLDPDAFARYVDEVTGYWRELDRMEDAVRKRVVERLREISGDLTDRILFDTRSGDFPRLGGHNVRQLKELVDRLSGKFEEDLLADAQKAAQDAFELGRGPTEAASEIMGAEPIGPDEYARVDGISRELMDVSRDFFADKIQGLTDDLKREISGEISLGALGARDPVEVIRNIRRSLLGAEAPGHGGYVYRSQLIFRTELGRIFSTADHEFGKAFLSTNPDMLKGWGTMGDDRVRPEHVDAGETYDEEGGIPLDKSFVVGGEELMYPRDPRGSARMTVG